MSLDEKVPFPPLMARWVYQPPGSKKRLFIAYSVDKEEAIRLFQAANLGYGEIKEEGVKEENEAAGRMWEKEAMASIEYGFRK